MAHLQRDKGKLLARVRRIRGQLEAVEKALEEERDCGSTMQLIAACRGAMNGLLAEVVESHIRWHLVDPDRDPTSEQSRSAEELIEAIRTYWK